MTSLEGDGRDLDLLLRLATPQAVACDPVREVVAGLDPEPAHDDRQQHASERGEGCEGGEPRYVFNDVLRTPIVRNALGDSAVVDALRAAPSALLATVA